MKKLLKAAIWIATSMLIIRGSLSGESDGTFPVTVEKPTDRVVANPPNRFQGIVPYGKNSGESSNCTIIR